MEARVLAFFRSRKPSCRPVTLPPPRTGRPCRAWLVPGIPSPFQFCPLRAVFIASNVQRGGDPRSTRALRSLENPFSPARQEDEREDGAGQRDAAADPEHRVHAL